MALLEFMDGSRTPFELTQREVLIGRGAQCAVKVDGEGVAERHLMLSFDGSGGVFIQDLDSFAGTLRNGEFVYGKQKLGEGDLITVGNVTLRFWATATARAGAMSDAERTQITTVPPEVLAALARSPSDDTTPPLGIQSLADDDERDGRTMQMESGDIEALLAMAPPPKPAAPPSIGEPAALPPPPSPSLTPAPLAVEAPKPEPPKTRNQLSMDATMPPLSKSETDKMRTQLDKMKAAAAARRTMIGVAAPVLPGAPGRAASPASKPAASPTPPVPQAKAPTERTGEILSPPVRTTAAGMSTASTMQLDVPVLPGKTAPHAAAPAPAGSAFASSPASSHHEQATARTMALPAPVLPVSVAAPAAPSAALMDEATAKTAAGPAPSAATLAPPPAAPPRIAAPYTPPQHKGAFGSFSRAFAFMGQMLTLAGQNRTLLRPLVLDLIITTPISIAISIAMSFVHTRAMAYTLLGLGTAILYFVDYACNSLTASLMFDHATTGKARMEDAMPRVRRALGGVLTFAAVSAFLDVASTYARERDDVASRILLRILRAIWTTATYVIMPALVIEGVSFGDAFKRSKALMDRDPTGVGAGVVAMSITSYLAAAVIFPLAWFALRYGALIHPAVGGILFFLLVNLYWSVSGWLKIGYSTCFYLWARECERTQSTDHALAPLPLRAALDAA